MTPVTCRSAALAALLALSACGHEPETPPLPLTADTPISRSEAANAIYASENTASGRMQLVDGHYADDDLVTGDLDVTEARGDVDGDGRPDLAVLLVTGTGGSGVFRELYLLRRTPEGLAVSAPALLGDRVEVNALRIEQHDIVVDLLVQGENDPLCCPTQAVTYRFRLVAGELIETTGRQRVYLKQ
ncbi:MAG: hypothetical protein ACOY33_10770 [Pseudomonadota bacterium]